DAVGREHRVDRAAGAQLAAAEVEVHLPPGEQAVVAGLELLDEPGEALLDPLAQVARPLAPLLERRHLRLDRRQHVVDDRPEVRAQRARDLRTDARDARPPRRDFRAHALLSSSRPYPIAATRVPTRQRCDPRADA